jgi:hypothetical protein
MAFMLLTVQELKVAASFLRQAKTLCESVRDLFFGTREADASARLDEIATRLDDEREFVERLIAKEPNGGAAS